MNADSTAVEEREVQVQAGNVTLQANLGVPADAVVIVVFAHGSGSSRFSPRNRFVAQILQQGRLATLLCDLLTPAEERIDRITREVRFDIKLLGERVVGTTDWVLRNPELKSLPIGCFGASTGAAAALIAAARRPHAVEAVVSRGGRPDLAMEALPSVQAPTLLIVGGLDTPVIEMNRTALTALQCEKELAIVPGATHLFEEPGTLEEAANTARKWFISHLMQDPKDEESDGESSSI